MEAKIKKAFDDWPGWRGSDALSQAFEAGWYAALAAHAPQPKSCPQCRASDEVGAYVDGRGVPMASCGRCMIQWQTAPVTPAVPQPSPEEAEHGRS